VSVPCVDALDTNDDGETDVSDAPYLGAFLFQQGPPPPAPYPDCGTDLYDSDELFCVDSTCVGT